MKDKYLDFPIRKTFIEEFINEKGKIIFSIKYEQATMGEYFEFLAQTIEQQELEVYNLIHKNISLTIFERFLSFFSPTYRGKLERKLDLGKIVQKILSNKFRIHNSIFNNKKKKGTKKYYEAINPIMSASFANICEKYSMSPLELLNNYTLEQYSWLND
ncbi:MAG: hypothetical protein LBQ24_00900 [Candidatus Peribacteria bacterium]|jgi:hypothetical protein|nr:hypothetical protein [Candidatus Peribacteria bacterium]